MSKDSIILDNANWSYHELYVITIAII